MRFRMVMGALLKIRNLGVLLLSLGTAYVMDMFITGTLVVKPSTIVAYSATYIPFTLAGMVYLGFVGQTLLSGNYHEKFNHKEKIRHIQDLNYACSKAANEAKKHTNASHLQRLRKVMDDKNEIVNCFFRDEQSFIKEKIVEKSLSLVLAYVKLLMNFCIRSKELNEMDLSDINDRINTNTRKLNFTKDVHMAEDLRSLLEMDQKIIQRLREEKKELERIGAKLDYMESTVSLFKHQILSSIESEEMLGKLETAVNEAVALDHVLEDRRRNRMRI